MAPSTSLVQVSGLSSRKHGFKSRWSQIFLVMKKIAVIGDYESIVIYKPFSWDMFYVNLANEDEVVEIFKNVAKDVEYEKIFVTASVYQILIKTYPDFDKEKIVIPFSDVYGIKNVAKQKYKKLVTIATSIKLEEV